MTNDEFGDIRPEGFGDPITVGRFSPRGPVWVYTHLAEDGSPLYIGCSSYPDRRLGQHRRGAKWFSEVADVRYLGPFDEFTGARTEERLIRQHRPAHNKQMNKPNEIEAFIAERAS